MFGIMMADIDKLSSAEVLCLRNENKDILNSFKRHLGKVDGGTSLEMGDIVDKLKASKAAASNPDASSSSSSVTEVLLSSKQGRSKGKLAKSEEPLAWREPDEETLDKLRKKKATPRDYFYEMCGNNVDRIDYFLKEFQTHFGFGEDDLDVLDRPIDFGEEGDLEALDLPKSPAQAGRKAMGRRGGSGRKS